MLSRIGGADAGVRVLFAKIYRCLFARCRLSRKLRRHERYKPYCVQFLLRQEISLQKNSLSVAVVASAVRDLLLSFKIDLRKEPTDRFDDRLFGGGVDSVFDAFARRFRRYRLQGRIRLSARKRKGKIFTPTK